MRTVRYAMDLDGACPIRENVLLSESLKRGLPSGLRQTVWMDGARGGPRFFVISAVRFVSNDCSAFIRVRPEAAGMIEVMMGVDHESNRFARDHLFNLCEHCQ